MLEEIDDQPCMALERQLGIAGLTRESQYLRGVRQPPFKVRRRPECPPPARCSQRSRRWIVELVGNLGGLGAQGRHPVALRGEVQGATEA